MNFEECFRVTLSEVVFNVILNVEPFCSFVGKGFKLLTKGSFVCFYFVVADQFNGQETGRASLLTMRCFVHA